MFPGPLYTGLGGSGSRYPNGTDFAELLARLSAVRPRRKVTCTQTRVDFKRVKKLRKIAARSRRRNWPRK